MDKNLGAIMSSPTPELEQARLAALCVCALSGDDVDAARDVLEHLGLIDQLR